MQPEHIASPDPNILPTSITDTGAMAAYSGLRTGRSPKDKRIVMDETTKDVRIFEDLITIFIRKSGGAVSTFLLHQKDTLETRVEP